MVGPTEKRLLWHPRLDDKFLVGGGSQVTLYEWVAESSEIKHVTSKQDLNLMKCVAWSPDPAYDDLVAVGFASGKVDLVRLEATRSARSQVLSSGPSITLPVRNSRSCNALAFCSADPNYLAVGLDKVRGDASLVVWDIVTATPTLSVRSPTQSAYTLVPGPVPRPQPVIPRGELAPRTDPRVLQQLAQTEVVTSVSFLPKSTSLLLAGISHRWLRLFDLRNPTPTVFTAASKVHGIATDPFDPHRIACYGDGIATIWDARRMAHPLLTFTEKDASADGAKVRTNATLTTVEFSPVRRGLLATLEKEASHVRFWDLQQVEVSNRTPDRSRSRDSTQSTRAIRLSWANPSNMLPWANAANTHSPAPIAPADTSRLSHHLVLANTRKTKNFNKTLASFAFVPSGDTCPLTSDVMVVNREGDLELYALHDTPVHIPWSSRGDFAMGLGRSYAFVSGFHEIDPPPEPWELDLAPAPPPQQSTPHSLSRQLTLDEAPQRGRQLPTVPTFGRGDEDGFPALSSAFRAQANLAATRPGAPTHTPGPAALRLSNFDHGVAAKKQVASPRNDFLKLGAGKPGRRKSKGLEPLWGQSTETTMQHVIEGDISMTMRKRVIHGYGLASPLHNSIIASDLLSDTTLSELWLWVDHIQHLLSAPPITLQGHSFAYQGIYGIWEGFRPRSATSTQPTPRIQQRGLLLDVNPNPVTNVLIDSHGHTRSRSRHRDSKRNKNGAETPQDEFSSAIAALLAEKRPNQISWKPAVATNRLAHRQLALCMCGWSLAEEDLAQAVKRWEKEHRYTQAACWLVFTKQHRAAVELLMRSKDVSHHMMSGMLAALSPSSGGGGGPKNPDLREHCERLIVRSQDPYVRATLTHLTVHDDWTEVLDEEALPLRERLAIALQFLSDKELSVYLRRVLDRCVHDGDVEGLLVSGLTSQGMDILQTYLDVSGDVQTVAIIASLNPARALERRTEQWLDAYRDLLDGWKLFHYRCQLDIDRGRILLEATQSGDGAVPTPAQWTKAQVVLRCNYCNKPLSPPLPNNVRATGCSHCGRSLPRCSICLMTLSIAQDAARNAELYHAHEKDTIDEALVFCQTCRHGGHASHILGWFCADEDGKAHEVCPVATCQCRCADGF